MSFEHKVKLSLEDFKKYNNDNEDYEFAYATVDFLSNRPNTHLHIYSEEVIKEFAPTVINKWVIAEYDNFTNDALTHTTNQKIVGRVPEQEVRYRYDEDGYLVASVDVVLSKLYATDIYEIFRRNDKRAVSIEELVGFTPETEMFQDGLKEKVITGFNITGITILGLTYKPSIPNANIKITQMSEDMLQNIEDEYIKYSKVKSDITMVDIMTKLNEIDSKISKEENMAKQEEQVLENIVDMSESEEQVVVENACGETETVEENACTEKESQVENGEQVECETESQENACENAETVEENACETVEENACGSEKMAELEVKLSEAESTISQYEAELSELRTFKKNVQMAEKNGIISQTLSQVKDYISEEKYNEFSATADACEYENIGAWKNEVLASITEQTLAKMSQMTSKEDGITDLGMPKENETKTSIFD